MKIPALILLFSGIAALGFIPANVNTLKEGNPEVCEGSYPPVAVLELFTSEGCSSCPPADRLLPELVKTDSAVVALAFHVDYWNYLGWKDPFSSKQFSDRQRNYVEQMHLESAYTPQLVVNGTDELIGSIRSRAQQAIQDALKENATARLAIHDVKQQGNTISFNVSVQGEIKNTDILAALVEKEATVKIKAGENSGVSLLHTNVVRLLVTKAAADSSGFVFTLPPEVNNGNWQLVAYSQRKNDWKITGATVYTP